MEEWDFDLSIPNSNCKAWLQLCASGRRNHKKRSWVTVGGSGGREACGGGFMGVGERFQAGRRAERGRQGRCSAGGQLQQPLSLHLLRSNKTTLY